MNRKTFKMICHEVFGYIPSPLDDLIKDYDNSLTTAPVSDSKETARQFLESVKMEKKWFERPTGDCFTDDVEYFIRPRNVNKSMSENNFCLAPLPKAVPVCQPKQPPRWIVDDCIKEEGKTPMRYNDNYASASASIASPKSDTAVQRDFLLEELAKADYPKRKELEKIFNLYVDNTPRTFKEMIDIIKAGTYTIDAKIAKKIAAFDTSDDGNDLSDYCYGPMYGIVWPGPVYDRDGYLAAGVEQGKQYAAAKRIIMTGDAAAGLKALQAFEAWTPSVTASSDTAH